MAAADYCPDFNVILGEEGGSIENVTAPDCEAFKKVAEEFKLEEVKEHLAVIHGMLGFDEIGEMNLETTNLSE